MAIDTRELMRQVRRIRVVSTRPTDEHLSGEYHSVFKGRGIEFDEVREYVPGDDVRSIDWNVTARMGHPYVKRYREERELTVLFVVDVSGSQSFGSRDRSKAEVAAELTCLLALSAIKNQDKVGLVLFSDRVVKYLRPRRGRNAVMRLVREVLAAERMEGGTDIAGVLRFLARVQKHRAVVFLISDFMCDGYDRDLSTAARRHDVVCCPVSDPSERDIPALGVIAVQDPESGELMLLDTSSRAVRRMAADRARAEDAAQRALFGRLKLDNMPVATDRPFIDDVRRLFRKRKQGKGRRPRRGKQY